MIRNDSKIFPEQSVRLIKDMLEKQSPHSESPLSITSSRAISPPGLTLFLHMPEKDVDEAEHNTLAKAMSDVLHDVLSEQNTQSRPSISFRLIEWPSFRLDELIQELVYIYTQYPSEMSENTYVLTLMYLDRYLLCQPSETLHSQNICGLLITSFLLATKVLDDNAVYNREVAELFEVNNQQINDFERVFLKKIGFFDPSSEHSKSLHPSYEALEAYKVSLLSYRSARIRSTNTRTESPPTMFFSRANSPDLFLDPNLSIKVIDDNIKKLTLDEELSIPKPKGSSQDRLQSFSPGCTMM
jgi:hypothetical protein